MLPKDNRWSVHFPNGTWLGLFGMLQRNEIDFVLGPSYTMERVQDFDPTNAMFTSK